MCVRHKSSLIVAFISLTIAAQSAWAAEPYAVTIEHGVVAKMRDGTALRADIYRPKTDGNFPVLLQRTPYDKISSDSVRFGVKAAARGYVVIIQDVRGRYTSDGEWYPFEHESNDGYDTVEWAASLPYSNGKVGMFGGSYVGATQMLTAIAHPPHLAGICPVRAFVFFCTARWSVSCARPEVHDSLNHTIPVAASFLKLRVDPFPGSVFPRLVSSPQL